jgi:uncharacterized protein YndB with AHSA1/START domain
VTLIWGDMLEGMKTHSFKIAKVIKAPRERVYEAWTNDEIVAAWHAPETCEVTYYEADLRVGGRYFLTMQTPYGEMRNQGVFLDIDPGHELNYTFVWEVADTEENFIKVQFLDQGRDTKVIFTGSNFSKKNEAEGNKEGWESSIEKLSQLFAHSVSAQAMNEDLQEIVAKVAKNASGKKSSKKKPAKKKVPAKNPAVKKTSRKKASSKKSSKEKVRAEI